MRKKPLTKVKIPSTALLPALVFCTALGTACGGTDKDHSGTDTGSVSDTGDSCEERMYYEDRDGDGFGSEVAQAACTAPEGYVERSGDCDDLKSQVHPEAEEACNNRDDDCDGKVDSEELMQPVFEDLDGDGFGDPTTEVLACPGTGWVVDGCDCDDSDPNANIYPPDCPALECPSSGGIWLHDDCASGTDLSHLDAYEFTENSALTFCPGNHNIELTVATSKLVVHGSSVENTTWISNPALTVTRDNVLVKLQDLTWKTTTTTPTVGMMVDTQGEGLDLQLIHVDIGPTLTGNYATASYAASLMEVNGDLTMEESRVVGAQFHNEVGSSPQCIQVALNVSGDLHLVNSEISGIDFLCRGGTHSAWPWQTAYGIQVGGDATLESTSFDGNFIEGSAMYGIGAQTDAALLKVGGDLSANNVTMLNNSLTTGLDCYYRDCYRYQTGGMIWAEGTIDWTEGSILQNTLELTGTLNQPASWIDAFNSAPVYWTGGESHTLTFTQTDFGSGNSPDIAGSVALDAEGVSSISCSSSGCN